MALPVPQKTWILSPNNRIAYVSLLDTTQRFVFGVKEFLKANGYAVKGSCSAGTGAMDGVDRWATSASVTPRATVAAASQAWVVLTDGNGADILLTFQGSSDDICRLSFSPNGLFVAAGTPNQQPTATDEQLFSGGATIVGITTSGDRIWNGWVTSDAKQCRFMMFSGATNTGRVWGVEEFDSQMDPIVTSKAVFGWSVAGVSLPNGTLPNGVSMSTAVSGCWFRIAGTTVSAPVYANVESFPNSGAAANYSQTWGTLRPELQAALGYPIFPLSLCSQTAGARGKMGTWIDCWQARLDALPGDTYGSLAFISVRGINDSAISNAGVIWPWDGSSLPVLV